MARYTKMVGYKDVSRWKPCSIKYHHVEDKMYKQTLEAFLVTKILVVVILL